MLKLDNIRKNNVMLMFLLQENLPGGPDNHIRQSKLRPQR